MYRVPNHAHRPFSQPSGTAGFAVGSVILVAGVLALVVACGHKRVSEPPADGTVATTASSNRSSPPSAPLSVPSSGAGIAVPADVSYETAESAYVGHRYPTAVAMFTAYTTRRPDNAWGYYMLGLSSWRAGQLDGAQHAFETALAHDPRQVKSLVNLARVLLDEKRPTDALARVNDALAIDSGLGEAWRVLGRVEAQVGHTDAAVEAYRKAICIDSTDVWAMNNLGLALIEAGRYGDAVGPLARAAQLDSTVPTFENNLGIALERSGHFTAAAVAYRGALAADSGYAKARASLQRVDGRPDATGSDPVDISALAAQFAAATTGAEER